MFSLTVKVFVCGSFVYEITVRYKKKKKRGLGSAAWRVKLILQILLIVKWK